MKKIIILILLLLLSCATIKIKNQVAVDYYNLGNNYLNLKDYKNAIVSYEKSLEYDSNSPETILNLIIACQENKEYEKVERIILKYYKSVKYEYTKKLLMLLGNNFYFQGKYNQAIKIYNDYLESYPDDANAYFNLGLTYLILLDEEKAINYFIEAYKKNSKHIPSIYNLALYYFKKKDYDNSMLYFNQLISLDSKNPDAYYKIGLVEYEINEFDKAREHISKAIELDKKNNDYYITLAKIYAKGYKNKDKTISNLESAFKNGYKDLKTLRNIEEFKLLFEFDDFKKILKQYDIK